MEVFNSNFPRLIYKGSGLVVSMEEEKNMLDAWNPSSQDVQLLNLNDLEEEIEVDGYHSDVKSESDEKRHNMDEEIEGRV